MFRMSKQRLLKKVLNKAWIIDQPVYNKEFFRVYKELDGTYTFVTDVSFRDRGNYWKKYKIQFYGLEKRPSAYDITAENVYQGITMTDDWDLC